MMNKIYNIGIIGAGMIAEVHIQNLQKTERANIKWVADIKPEVLSNVGKTYKIDNTTADYKDILQDKDVDAVVICTPPQFHFLVFKDCIEAGKHILMEKPCAMSLEEIDKMIALTKAYPDLKVLDCSGRHSRLQPKFKKVKEIIESGKLGEIYYIHHNSVWRQARAGIEYHPKAKWFLNKAIAGGGPLFDWGVYDLSFHLGVLNDNIGLKDINSVILKDKLDAVDPGTDIYDVEEHFIANIKLTGNVDFYWERAAHANMETPNETRIYGTKGGIKLGYCSWDSPIIEFFDVTEKGKGKARKEEIEIDLETHDDSHALSEHFINILDGKEEPIMSLELARKHLDIIFKCYKKAEEKNNKD